jgi:hypothetical protein
MLLFLDTTGSFCHVRRVPQICPQERSTVMTRISSRSSVALPVVFMFTIASSITYAAQPNYDPPQPSAEFGTPEATARIAASAQSLDIVGVKPGMSFKAAQDAVKAHNANIKLEPQMKFEFEALPGVAITPVFSGQSKTADGGTEYIGILLTSAPNEPFVYGVWRDFSFGKKESMPTVDNIVTGLRKKYGQESVREDALLLWLFDAQKQQVMGAKATDIWKKCANHWMTGAAYDIGNIQRQVARGYYTVSDGKDYFGGICHSHSLVQARYLADTPPGASQPLIMNVKVSASNRQVEASGVTATNALLTREATKLAEKRKEEASKRSGPKF